MGWAKANLATLKSVRDVLNSDKKLQASKTYVEYMASCIDMAWQIVNGDDTGDHEEFLFEMLSAFTQSTDAERVRSRDGAVDIRLPPMERQVGVAPHPDRNASVVRRPLDVPKKDDIAQQKKSQAEIVAWWQRNKNKRPVSWMLDNLAKRGYATRNPEDTEATGRALVLTLRKGSPASGTQPPVCSRIHCPTAMVSRQLQWHRGAVRGVLSRPRVRGGGTPAGRFGGWHRIANDTIGIGTHRNTSSLPRTGGNV